MKVWLKILIGVAVGFGGGFASGFFAHKKLNDVEFEEVSEEEMKSIEARVEEATKRATENAVPKEKDIPENLPDDPDKLKMALQGKKPYSEADKEQKLAYERMWATTKDYSSQENADNLPVMDEEAFEEQENAEEPEKPDEWVDPPHVIGLADFYNDRPENDKVTINWYEPDNTWLDENEDVIPDIKSYIGMEVAELFASNSPDDDPDVRFVRNDKYGSDYEIVRHHRSLRETVGGV